MNSPFYLRESTLAKEGQLQASKLIKLPVLFDPSELRDCFNSLEKEFGEFFLFPVQGIVEKKIIPFDKGIFFAKYQTFIDDIKRGREPEASLYSPFLSLICTIDPALVYSISVDESRCIVKPSRPVIQIQMHYVHYSKENNEFHSMVYSKESIAWGLHITYPQLYQDNHTHEIYSVKEGSLFPNTALFKGLQRWVRYHTSSTTFIIENNCHTKPLRMGKECKKWIAEHSKLKQYGICVK